VDSTGSKDGGYLTGRVAMEKLIIIRGPSGVGKSKVARALKERTNRPTFLLEQDLLRPNFNDQGPKATDPLWEMIEACTLIGLRNNFDVIMEGILNVKKPGRRELYERIFQSHPDENYIFYMDASFQETVKRHATRPDKKDQFGEESMRQWYGMASPMEHASETIIPESSTFEETVALIGKVAGLSLRGDT
jgi:gluconate kinase